MAVRLGAFDPEMVIASMKQKLFAKSCQHSLNSDMFGFGCLGTYFGSFAVEDIDDVCSAKQREASFSGMKLPKHKQKVSLQRPTWNYDQLQ